MFTLDQKFRVPAPSGFTPEACVVATGGGRTTVKPAAAYRDGVGVPPLGYAGGGARSRCCADEDLAEEARAA